MRLDLLVWVSVLSLQLKSQARLLSGVDALVRNQCCSIEPDLPDFSSRQALVALQMTDSRLHLILVIVESELFPVGLLACFCSEIIFLVFRIFNKNLILVLYEINNF